MKTLPFALACLAIFGSTAGCSKQEQRMRSGSLPSLPSSWVHGSGRSGGSDSPSPEVAKAVRSAFQVHTAALENGIPSVSAASIASLESPDSVPWHLDGMIGSFAIDVGGVFGALVGDGDAGVKVTWQKQQQSAVQTYRTRTAPKRTSLRFNANMTTQDVAAMLEPAVQMAVATHSVQDAASLRQNLMAESTKFLSTVRILSHVQPTAGWHIDGFQLGLFLGANGQVTPLMGMGGNIALYFDWTVPSTDLPVVPPSLDPQEALVAKNIVPFVQTLSVLIPEAATDATEIRKAGFEFQVFQVGLGLGVGGNVGIASVQSSAVGRIIFKSNAASGALATSQMRMVPRGKTLNFILPTSSSLAGDTGEGAVIPDEANRFRDGIRRALRMGVFFAQQAAQVDTPNWKTTEIELGFDTNLGADIGLATVQGVGLIRLGFERVEN